MGMPSLRTAGLGGDARGTLACSDLTTFQRGRAAPALAPTLWRSPIHRTGVCWRVKWPWRVRVWSCAEHRLLQELGDPNVPNHLFGSALTANTCSQGQQASSLVRVVCAQRQE